MNNAAFATQFTETFFTNHHLCVEL